jgi:lysozyme
MKTTRRRPYRLLSVAVVAICVISGSALSAPPAEAARGGARGIDVSHWQGAIDWQKVRGAGKKFALLKATEGTSFVDPKFATYRAGARAAGIVTGAYHYARPDSTPGDAVTEAQWLVSHIAPLASDDLVPALDLEATGGLSATALTQWVLDWMNEVYRLTGRQAMVFTWAGFWRNNLADSQVVAQAGYGFWASDGSAKSSPRLPANNWAGNGWWFWKYDNCGSVAGIAGCVDLDRSNGVDLTAYM